MTCNGSGRIDTSRHGVPSSKLCPGCAECLCPDCGGLRSTHPMVKSPEGGHHLDITKSTICSTCHGTERKGE